MSTIDIHTAGGLLTLGLIVANAVGRAIPDSATGVAGTVRKLAKFVGLYFPNRT